MTPYDLTNLSFGKLTVLHSERTSNGQYGWLCRCECGNTLVVRTTDLTRGHTRSCGCTRTHGLSRTPLYDTWYNILRRCCMKSSKDYPLYGGRGITICEEWKDYPVFYNWAITHGYKEGLTIDRIDNEKGYDTQNCRFVTMKTQERNKRNNIWIVHDDKEMLLIEFAEKFNIPYTTVYWRYKHGRNLLTGRCESDGLL